MAQVEGHGDEYTLFNMDSGLPLARRVQLAGDSGARRKGLLGVESLAEDAGLWIVPCEAIHTFGMKMPIDVLFLDRQFTVKKVRERMPPQRISACLAASSVVEMRAGTIAGSQTKVGDRLSVRRVGEDGTLPAQTIPFGSACPSS